MTKHEAIDSIITNIRNLNTRMELDLIKYLQPEIESATGFFLRRNWHLINELYINTSTSTIQQIYKNYADEILLTVIMTDYAPTVRFFNGDRSSHIESRFNTVSPYLQGERGTRASRSIDHYLFLNSKTIINDISRLKGFGFDDTEAVLGALDRPGGCGYTPDFYRTRAQGMVDRFEILQRTHPDYDGTHLLLDARRYLDKSNSFGSNPITKLFTGTWSVLYQRLMALVRFEINDYNGRNQDDLMDRGTKAVEVINYGPDGDGHEEEIANDFIDIVNPHSLYQDNEDRWQEFLDEHGKQFYAGLKPNLQKFFVETVLQRGERQEIMDRIGLSVSTFTRRVRALKKAYKDYCEAVGWDTEAPTYIPPDDDYDDLKREAAKRRKAFKGSGIVCSGCGMTIRVADLTEFNECSVCGRDLL